MITFDDGAINVRRLLGSDSHHAIEAESEGWQVKAYTLPDTEGGHFYIGEVLGDILKQGTRRHGTSISRLSYLSLRL
ncbi:hypothetical protein EWM64_g9401 [Hericium alpestre]|uniref:Uncharacterized protein n=1 Tax=Hericium alpestre TaxID=135208 RepID=A0A4Y9ZLB2_9AGAM|nr:hypothetical protein EWM64_g9401 [Hericium alpestre]